ncbi:Putative aminoglycoside phosphotransferase [Roseivivax sp. THAF40]|uniref:phosphotransferase family protein n=1 Tax=unclassified Roseivivax TaxID=2639302 RepID=UPI00126917D7|nr:MULTISPECIES: phosphotransferase family protein [unclassified Roseivivax]QFS81497.1 Putative aminoglycoside phosphotransferase [Roseivivax sp. THAF197b]QFT45226.1 Putative aminoglycoside phosphotransferase [Roseivivax sp. THAF40]
MAELDITRVGRWMAANVPGYSGPLSATKFDVGQSNPTYRLNAGSGSYVLRRKPPGTLLKSAHAVDREFRVQKALFATDVPVPKVIALCEDEDVIGSMFYVMTHVTGRNIDDPSMPDLVPGERGDLIAEMARVLAAIHDVDIDAVGLSDFGPPGNYYERQLGRWTKQYRASETEPLPDMDRLIDRLGAEMPDDDGQRTLVHGDYRIDNMLFDTERPTCTAVLDWELSTLGHPLADLAGVIMQWQMPPGAEGRGLAGLDRAALGLPSDEEFVAMYCAHRGIAPPARFGYYVAFAFFRMAAILQGVKKRALDGNASNPEAGLRLGAYVPRFAALGLDWLER